MHFFSFEWRQAQSDTAVGSKYNFFQKTDRCNYLEYSRDAVLVIYESLLATKKIREIRVRLKRIILSVEHESFETKQLIRVIRAIRVPKKIRNSRAEKYLLL